LEDDVPINLQGELSLKPIVEEFTNSLDGVKHYRGCSFKPHACENYDIMLRANYKVVLAQGIDVVNYVDTVVVPTVLLTSYKFNPSRYKATFEVSRLKVIDSKTQFDKLFHLFEIPLPAMKDLLTN
jgi:hypothetical protein